MTEKAIDEVRISFEDERNKFSAIVQRYWGHRSRRQIVTVTVQLETGNIIASRPLSIIDAERVRDTLNAAISKAKELALEVGEENV